MSGSSRHAFAALSQLRGSSDGPHVWGFSLRESNPKKAVQQLSRDRLLSQHHVKAERLSNFSDHSTRLVEVLFGIDLCYVH